MVKSGKKWENCIIFTTSKKDISMFFSFESYNCSIDDKGRILIPAKFRKENESLLSEGFVLKRSIYFPCLELYPLSEWKKQLEKLNKLNPFAKKNLEFIQGYTAGVRIIELDKSNRILIPKDLASKCFSGKEIVMSPMGDRYQLWDSEVYEQHLQNVSVDFDENYQDVIEKLDSINLD